MCSGESSLGSGVTFPFPGGGREARGLRRLEGRGPPQSDQSTPQHILACPSVLLGYGLGIPRNTMGREVKKKAGRRAERSEPRPARVACPKSRPRPASRGPAQGRNLDPGVEAPPTEPRHRPRPRPAQGQVPPPQARPRPGQRLAGRAASPRICIRLRGCPSHRPLPVH